MKDIEQIGTQIENEIAQVVTEAVEPPPDTPPAPRRKTKLTERTAAKVTAFLLLMVMAMTLCGGTLAALVFYNADVYITPEDDFKRELLEGVAYNDVYNLISWVVPDGEGRDRLEKAEAFCANRNIAYAAVRDGTGTELWHTGNAAYDSLWSFTVTYDWRDWEAQEAEGTDGEETLQAVENAYTAELVLDDAFPFEDEYELANRLADIAYALRYWIYAILAAAALLAVVCFIFLLCAAGHRSRRGRRPPRLGDQDPLRPADGGGGPGRVPGGGSGGGAVALRPAVDRGADPGDRRPGGGVHRLVHEPCPAGQAGRLVAEHPGLHGPPPVLEGPENAGPRPPGLWLPAGGAAPGHPPGGQDRGGVFCPRLCGAGGADPLPGRVLVRAGGAGPPVDRGEDPAVPGGAGRGPHVPEAAAGRQGTGRRGPCLSGGHQGHGAGLQIPRRGPEPHRPGHGGGGGAADAQRADEDGAHHQRLPRHQDAPDLHHQLRGPHRPGAQGQRQDPGVRRRPHPPVGAAEAADRGPGGGVQGLHGEPGGESGPLPGGSPADPGGGGVRAEAEGRRAGPGDPAAGDGR